MHHLLDTWWPIYHRVWYWEVVNSYVGMFEYKTVILNSTYPKPLISSSEPESILHAYIHLHVWYVVCSIPILIVLSARVELWYTLFRLTFCMLILNQGFLTFSYRKILQNSGLMSKVNISWRWKTHHIAPLCEISISVQWLWFKGFNNLFYNKLQFYFLHNGLSQSLDITNLIQFNF